MRAVSRANAVGSRLFPGLGGARRGHVQRNSSGGCSTLSASNQSKFLPTLRRASLFGERGVGSHPDSKAAQSISLNRVRLMDQKAGGIQFIHFGEVFSRQFEVVLERSAAFHFKKSGSAVEHLLDAPIQLLIVCRAEACSAPIHLIQLVEMRTHNDNLSDQAKSPALPTHKSACRCENTGRHLV